MTDFSIDGKAYRTNKLGTMVQMEIARRYSSVLVFIGDVKAKTEKENPGKTTPKSLGQAILLAASQLPAEDQQFVVGSALSIVFRIIEGTPQTAMPVREPSSGRLMFDDITPVALAEIVYRVLEDHGLVDFFVDPPQTSPG